MLLHLPLGFTSQSVKSRWHHVLKVSQEFGRCHYYARRKLHHLKPKFMKNLTDRGATSLAGFFTACCEDFFLRWHHFKSKGTICAQATSTRLHHSTASLCLTWWNGRKNLYQLTLLHCQLHRRISQMAEACFVWSLLAFALISPRDRLVGCPFWTDLNLGQNTRQDWPGSFLYFVCSHIYNWEDQTKPPWQWWRWGLTRNIERTETAS